MVAEDAGRLINPMIVDGQIHGGVAQGIANALLEEIIYDETGNILTATLADYLPPTAREMPPIEIHHLETLDGGLDHQGQGTGRGRRDRRAGRGRQRHQRRAVAVRRVDRRVPGDAAAHPRGAARGRARDRHDMSFVGRSVPRLEDRPLVTGRGRFAADVVFPRMLHMRVVRSAHAHGRIVSIDASAALALPGVVAVWTFDDVADIPPIDFRLTRIEGLAPYRQPILARQRVRYVGEPVAAVFATDPYLAEDAADLVAVEIEELPVVLDASARARRVRGRPLDRAGDRGKVLRRSRRRRSARRMRWSSSISRSAGIPACRWKRAARSRATTPPTTCWRCTAPPRCRTGTATTSPACSAAIPRPCICSRAMSAAASASAASSIPRTCWSASPRCGSAGR